MKTHFCLRTVADNNYFWDGEVGEVPQKGDRIHIDGEVYEVLNREWETTEAWGVTQNPDYPTSDLCVTIFVKKVKRKP